MTPPLLRWFWLGLAILVSLPGLLAQSTPALRTLVLVRHGFYDYDAKADDKIGNALNALGREQAAFVGERLRALPVKFSSVVSSEFTRARETGDIVAAILGTTCVRAALLNEATPPGAGLKPEQIDAHAEAQLEAAWKKFAVPGDGASAHDVLVCHGNVIRWFVCRAMGVDLQQWTRLEIANCSLTVMQVRADGSTRVQMFSDAAHVPLEKQTWSGKGPDWLAKAKVL